MRIALFDGYYVSPVQDGDQAAFVEHFRDEETTGLLLRIPFPYTEDDAESWVQFCMASLERSRPLHFGVRRRDGFLIGGTGFLPLRAKAAEKAELGYWLAKDYRGRGLATAAVRAMITYGFLGLKVKRIEATSACSNLASCRVLEKTGFQRESFLPGYHIKNDVPIDVYRFALLNPHHRPAAPA